MVYPPSPLLALQSAELTVSENEYDIRAIPFKREMYVRGEGGLNHNYVCKEREGPTCNYKMGEGGGLEKKICM